MQLPAPPPGARAQTGPLGQPAGRTWAVSYPINRSRASKQARAHLVAARGPALSPASARRARQHNGPETGARQARAGQTLACAETTDVSARVGAAGGGGLANECEILWRARSPPPAWQTASAQSSPGPGNWRPLELMFAGLASDLAKLGERAARAHFARYCTQSLSFVAKPGPFVRH